MTVKIDGKTYRVRFQRTTIATLSEVTPHGLDRIISTETKCHPLDEKPMFNQEKGEREALKRLLDVSSVGKQARKPFWDEYLYRWGIKPRPRVITAAKAAKIAAYKERVSKQRRLKEAKARYEVQS